MTSANGTGPSDSATVWDPATGYILKPNADGSLSIGGFSASIDGTATVAAPSYVEGTANPFSLNLTGDLRTIAKQSGTWNVTTVTTVTTVGTLTGGGVAHDSPLTANPITIGGKAISGAPTPVTANDVTNAMFDLYGSMHVTPCDATGVPLSTTNPVLIYRSDTFTPITTKTTTLVKSGAGTFTRVIVQPGTADTLTIYDALTATGTPIATLTIVATDRAIEFGCAFATGLCVVSGGTTAGNYCFVWR